MAQGIADLVKPEDGPAEILSAGGKELRGRFHAVKVAFSKRLELDLSHSLNLIRTNDSGKPVLDAKNRLEDGNRNESAPERAEGSVASACQGMVNFRELFGKFVKAQPGGQ